MLRHSLLTFRAEGVSQVWEGKTGKGLDPGRTEGLLPVSLGYVGHMELLVWIPLSPLSHSAPSTLPEDHPPTSKTFQPVGEDGHIKIADFGEQ